MKIRSLSTILGITLACAGCTTLENNEGLYGLTRANIDGRHMAYVGNKEQVEKYISKHNLTAYDVGNEIYAEGRTYGVNFAEVSTSKDLLDGSATDGCKKASNAIKRR